MEDSYLVCSCVGDIEDTLAKTGHCFLILGFLPTYSTSWIFYNIFIIRVRPTFTYINNGNGSRVFFRSCIIEIPHIYTGCIIKELKCLISFNSKWFELHTSKKLFSQKSQISSKFFSLVFHIVPCFLLVVWFHFSSNHQLSKSMKTDLAFAHERKA